LENSSSMYIVYIWKKHEALKKFDIPIIAIGNAREILLLCQRILAPRSNLVEFFQEYKRLGEGYGIDTKHLEVNSFLRVLSTMRIIDLYEIPKEIFSNGGNS